MRVAILVWTSAAAEKPTKNFDARLRVHPCRDIGEMLGRGPKGVLPRGPRGVLSFDTAYRSFSGEVEASSTPTICRLTDSRRHQLLAIALVMSGLLRGFSTCCLRFMGDVATAHARLASGWLAGLYREGVEPSGPR